MTSFPITNTPINSTTAFVLQRSKEPENDKDRLQRKLALIQKTRRTILCGKNTPLRKQQLKNIGRKEQCIVRKLQNVNKLLKQTKRYDVGKIFMEICWQTMPREQFEKIYKQATDMSDYLKRQREDDNE